MPRVTNEQLSHQMTGIGDRLDSLEGRVGQVEKVLMTRKNGSINPLAILLIKWVICPLILVTGGAIGITRIFPVGG